MIFDCKIVFILDNNFLFFSNQVDTNGVCCIINKVIKERCHTMSTSIVFWKCYSCFQTLLYLEFLFILQQSRATISSHYTASGTGFPNLVFITSFCATKIELFRWRLVAIPKKLRLEFEYVYDYKITTCMY